jgi:hypothetical protein
MKNPTLCAKSGNIYKGCRFQKHRCRPGVDSVGLGAVTVLDGHAQSRFQKLGCRPGVDGVGLGAVTVLDGPGAEACGGGTPFAIGHGGSRYRN